MALVQNSYFTFQVSRIFNSSKKKHLKFFSLRFAICIRDWIWKFSFSSSSLENLLFTLRALSSSPLLLFIKLKLSCSLSHFVVWEKESSGENETEKILEIPFFILKCTLLASIVGWSMSLWWTWYGSTSTRERETVCIMEIKSCFSSSSRSQAHTKKDEKFSHLHNFHNFCHYLVPSNLTCKSTFKACLWYILLCDEYTYGRTNWMLMKKVYWI